MLQANVGGGEQGGRTKWGSGQSMAEIEGKKNLSLKASEQKFRPLYYKAIVQMQSHPRKSAINKVDFFNCINDTDVYSHS